MADLSYAFNANAGETPDSVQRRRLLAQSFANHIFTNTPKNVGEGLSLLGQAFIARQMQNEANDAQKAGQANALSPAQIAAMTGGGGPSFAPTNLAPAASGGPVVPNDDNAIPGTVGMNQTLADHTQDFIQDNPGTTMTSGLRSTADQAALYADRANNPNPVAPPGSSLHERGMAADIGGMTPDQRAQLPQYGLSQPVANDPVHVQLASDPAALPANSTPAQGAITPRSQTYGGPFPSATNAYLMQQAGNAWNPKEYRAAFTAEISRRATMDQQASDPNRALDMKYKQSLIDKATRDAAQPEYGLNPVYGTGADGKPAIGVIGKDGTFKQIDTGGMNISAGIEKIDMGTQWQLRDKRNGQVIGYEPKDLRGAAREKGIGTAQGKDVAAAPADIQAGENAMDTITKIRTNPYLDRGTGAMSTVGNKIPGTGGYDFQNLVDAAKSGAFLQAIQHMRGLGSLSNVEGSTATAAINRMDTATSKDAFLGALDDYQKIVQQGMARSRSRLGDPSATNPMAGSAPAAAAPSAHNDPLGLR